MTDVIVFHFGQFFALSPPKNEHFKTVKKHMEIAFYISAPEIMIICYTVPEIRYVADVIFHFGLFFILSPF